MPLKFLKFLTIPAQLLVKAKGHGGHGTLEEMCFRLAGC